jgi:protein-S-isoprenylcysteine O-methyltransferase
MAIAAMLLVVGWAPMLVAMARQRRATAPAVVSAVDRALLVLTWGLCMALTALAALDVLHATAPRRVAAGVALFWLSMLGWVWARAAQGEHFAQAARVPPMLVTRGPYRVVRHPLYLATALGTAGQALAAGSAGAAALWLGLAIVLGARSVREERLLRAAFGPAWNAHARRTLGWLRPPKTPGDRLS